MAADQLLFGNLLANINPIRRFRRFESPLDYYSDEELYKRFRFRSDSIEFIANLVREDLERDTLRNVSLSVETQVLLAIRFFASGSFQELVGDSFGVSKSTASRTIHAVAQSLDNKKDQFIRWPTQDETAVIAHAFYQKARFPKVIGAIDGTHIQIQSPNMQPGDAHDHEAAYVNRNHYHSINCQFVCDHKGKYKNRPTNSSYL